MSRVTGIGGFFFRASDMVARLQAEGISVEPDPERYPNGRFAWLEDPEGNRIQLWEPNAAALARDPGPPSSSTSEA